MTEMTPELDHRFGWRILAPVAGATSLHLNGFDVTAEAALQEWFASARGTKQRRGSIALVEDSGPASSRGLAWAGVDGAIAACILSGRRAAGRWRRGLESRSFAVREYALLSARSPRVVVPLSHSERATLGLSLHRPGRRIARIAVWLARALLRLGVDWPLRGRVLLVATRAAGGDPSAGCALEGLLQEREDAAIYLGHPSELRKTIVLPLGRGVPDRIIKVAMRAQARGRLQREAGVLRDLQSTPLRGRVPRVLVERDAPDALAVTMEYRPRRGQREGVMHDAVRRFLRDLSSLEREGRALGDGDPPALAPSASPAVRALWERVAAAASARQRVWMHRAHGDFAPWNCSWTDGGLFVYDWEESRHAVAFGDAFYYELASSVHVGGGRGIDRGVERALALARSVADGGPMDRADLRLHLALWLLEGPAGVPPDRREMIAAALLRKWR